MREKTSPRASRQPDFIVLQRYSVYKDADEQDCQICANEPATHTIEIFEDMPHAIRLELFGEKSKKISEYLWKKVLTEQLQGKYVIYATMHTCEHCTDVALQEASGNQEVPCVFFAATQNTDIHLVIGVYSYKNRGKPIVALSAIEDITEFIREVKEQDSKQGKKGFVKLGSKQR